MTDNEIIDPIGPKLTNFSQDIMSITNNTISSNLSSQVLAEGNEQNLIKNKQSNIDTTNITVNNVSYQNFETVQKGLSDKECEENLEKKSDFIMQMQTTPIIRKVECEKEKIDFCNTHPKKRAKYFDISYPAKHFCSKCALDIFINLNITLNLSKDENKKRMQTEDFLLRLSTMNCDLQILKQRIQTDIRDIETSKSKQEFYQNDFFSNIKNTIQDLYSTYSESIKNSSISLKSIFGKKEEKLTKFEQEMDELERDVKSNYTNIIKMMDIEPFYEIMHRYNQKLNKIRHVFLGLKNQPAEIPENPLRLYKNHYIQESFMTHIVKKIDNFQSDSKDSIDEIDSNFSKISNSEDFTTKKSKDEEETGFNDSASYKNLETTKRKKKLYKKKEELDEGIEEINYSSENLTLATLNPILILSKKINKIDFSGDTTELSDKKEVFTQTQSTFETRNHLSRSPSKALRNKSKTTMDSFYLAKKEDYDLNLQAAYLIKSVDKLISNKEIEMLVPTEASSKPKDRIQNTEKEQLKSLEISRNNYLPSSLDTNGQQVFSSNKNSKLNYGVENDSNKLRDIKAKNKKKSQIKIENKSSMNSKSADRERNVDRINTQMAKSQQLNKSSSYVRKTDLEKQDIYNQKIIKKRSENRANIGNLNNFLCETTRANGEKNLNLKNKLLDGNFNTFAASKKKLWNDMESTNIQSLRPNISLMNSKKDYKIFNNSKDQNVTTLEDTAQEKGCQFYKNKLNAHFQSTANLNNTIQNTNTTEKNYRPKDTQDETLNLQRPFALTQNFFFEKTDETAPPMCKDEVSPKKSFAKCKSELFTSKNEESRPNESLNLNNSHEFSKLTEFVLKVQPCNQIKTEFVCQKQQKANTTRNLSKILKFDPKNLKNVKLAKNVNGQKNNELMKKLNFGSMIINKNSNETSSLSRTQQGINSRDDQNINKKPPTDDINLEKLQIKNEQSIQIQPNNNRQTKHERLIYLYKKNKLQHDNA